MGMDIFIDQKIFVKPGDLHVTAKTGPLSNFAAGEIECVFVRLECYHTYEFYKFLYDLTCDKEFSTDWEIWQDKAESLIDHLDQALKDPGEYLKEVEDAEYFLEQVRDLKQRLTKALDIGVEYFVVSVSY